MLAKDAVLDAEVYEVAAVDPSDVDYEAPKKIEVSGKTTRTPVDKGDFYVDCVQPAANLVPCLLEPQSDYGFVRYRKFKLVPETGGLFEILRYRRHGGPRRHPLPAVAALIISAKRGRPGRRPAAWAGPGAPGP